MATLQEQLEQSVGKFNQNADKVDAFINGTDVETITSATGEKPTIAKIVKDTETTLDNSMSDLTSKAAQVSEDKVIVENIKNGLDIEVGEMNTKIEKLTESIENNGFPQGYIEDMIAVYDHTLDPSRIVNWRGRCRSDDNTKDIISEVQIWGGRDPNVDTNGRTYYAFVGYNDNNEIVLRMTLTKDGSAGLDYSLKGVQGITGAKRYVCPVFINSYGRVDIYDQAHISTIPTLKIGSHYEISSSNISVLMLRSPHTYNTTSSSIAVNVPASVSLIGSLTKTSSGTGEIYLKSGNQRLISTTEQNIEKPFYSLGLVSPTFSRIQIGRTGSEQSKIKVFGIIFRR
ncbi:MAG: hypothetical protein GY793_09270 [Proteobacteria bacterium]|nr:hypothetical protein [Pseudomonadota bacterium]